MTRIEQVGSMSFTIKRVKRNWRLTREDVDGDLHSHFEEESGCYICLDYIKKRLIPRRRYMRNAVKRLVTEEEWLEFHRKHDKARYKNRR